MKIRFSSLNLILHDRYFNIIRLLGHGFMAANLLYQPKVATTYYRPPCMSELRSRLCIFCTIFSEFSSSQRSPSSGDCLLSLPNGLEIWLRRAGCTLSAILLGYFSCSPLVSLVFRRSSGTRSRRSSRQRLMRQS